MAQLAQSQTPRPTTTDVNLRLRNFPVSFFSVILGLAGTTIAFQRVEQRLGLPFTISGLILIITVAVFGLIALIYSLKLIRFAAVVKHEFTHPIRVNFFPTISISLLLLSVAFVGPNPTVSRYIWCVGAVAHILFTIAILSVWMQHTSFQIHHSNPSWFLPVVGNIIVPIAGVEHFPSDISWFFFSIGFIFWVALFAIFLNRIIFHTPLADRLVPTLFIMIAPPAIGFIAYVQLMSKDSSGFVLDGFAKTLYYFALFLFILLIAQYRLFFKLQFYLSWWAYSFPIAALTIASATMATKTHQIFFQWLTYGLLTFLSLVMITLITRTTDAILHKRICVEED